ncbi:MAG: hypothetical protein ACHP7N_09700 [Caulobacterales bacterium]
MSAEVTRPPTDEASEIPLNVAVKGNTVLVMGPDGADLVLSVHAAQRSAQRLLDAIALAQGHVPAPPS